MSLYGKINGKNQKSVYSLIYSQNNLTDEAQSKWIPLGNGESDKQDEQSIGDDRED